MTDTLESELSVDDCETPRESFELTSAPRYEGLDALRAGAMLLGLAYHATYAYVPDVGPWYPVADPSPSAFFSTLAGVLHAFRMHVFFAIAGFFSHLVIERRGPKGFLADRARRLLGPFAVAVPITWGADVAARVLSHRAGLMDEAYSFGTAPRWIPLHLWFLQYLFLFCAVAAALSWAQVRLPTQALRRVLAYPETLVLLAVPTGALLAVFGEPRPDASFVPEAGTFAVMGLFYGFGYLLWAARDAVGVLAQRGPWMALGGLCVAFWLYTRPLQWEPLGRALSGAIAWLVTLGALGAAFRVMTKGGAQRHPLLRTLVDASYWVYLVHYPLVQVLQVVVAGLPVWTGIKYLLVVVGAFSVALVTYFLVVRDTWLMPYLGRRPNG